MFDPIQEIQSKIRDGHFVWVGALVCKNMGIKEAEGL